MKERMLIYSHEHPLTDFLDLGTPDRASYSRPYARVIRVIFGSVIERRIRLHEIDR